MFGEIETLLQSYVDIKILALILLANNFFIGKLNLHEKVKLRKTYFVFVSSLIIIGVVAGIEVLLNGNTSIVDKLNSYFIATSFYELIWKKIKEFLNKKGSDPEIKMPNEGNPS
jgi:uncharacterized membrane protein YfcA